ncbi:MAG: alpha/beta fold hydrolase [Nonlabens sp.]
MKYTIWLLFSLITLGSYSQQQINGSFKGELMNMPLIFKLNTSKDGTLEAAMQSPSQHKAFLPATQASFKNDTLIVKLSRFGIEYKGRYENNIFEGTFTQSGTPFPMKLVRFDASAPNPDRPQEPIGELPYKSIDVTIKNWKQPSVVLKGTLTLPETVKNPPVAIFTSGSGPQNRDSEILGHKPFLVWSDYLTRNGIAVLRYDDRGVGESTGDYAAATTADLATDLEAALLYLKTRKDVNPEKIGLVGHSEGGAIAPMVIAGNPDKMAFFVSLAGTSLTGYDVLIPQLKRKALLDGVSEEVADYDNRAMIRVMDLIVEQTDLNQQELAVMLKKSLHQSKINAPAGWKTNYTDTVIDAISNQFSTDWFRYFIMYNPADNLKKIEVPSLLLNGTLDYQVIASHNLGVMENYIKSNGNDDVTAVELDGLNHLFQKAVTGAGTEYATIKETVDPGVLELVKTWINDRFQ